MKKEAIVIGIIFENFLMESCGISQINPQNLATFSAKNLGSHL